MDTVDTVYTMVTAVEETVETTVETAVAMVETSRSPAISVRATASS